MDAEEQAVKLAEVDQRARSNTRRIDKLEQSTDALTRLATSVEVMATKQDTMADTLDRLDGKVETLEGQPAKRWDAVVAAIISGVVAFVLGLLLRGGV